MAGIAIVAMAARPRSSLSAVVALACASAVTVAGAVSTAAIRTAIATTVPVVAFLTAVMWLAMCAERSGLADRVAGALVTASRGRSLALYALVCATSAILTAAVSLDAAIVLMVPVVAAVARSCPQLFRPLLLATIVVVNAFSVAVPQGNPTNLLLMGELGLSPGAFVAHLFVPALTATALCAAVVAVRERRALARIRFAGATRAQPRLTAAEWRSAASLAAVAISGWLASVVGVPPWIPICLVGAVAALWAKRRGTRLPPMPFSRLRLGVQVAALLVVSRAAAGSLDVTGSGPLGLVGLLVLTLLVGATAAATNNLPAGVTVAAALGAGPGSYGAIIGLGIGALGTVHGSVATLVALDLAGARAGLSPGRYLRVGLPLSVAAVVAATLGLWALGP